MATPKDELATAIEILVRGYCVGRSLTHPYLCERERNLWIMRDAPRRNPRDYRKEERVACGISPEKVDAAGRAAGFS